MEKVRLDEANLSTFERRRQFLGEQSDSPLTNLYYAEYVAYYLQCYGYETFIR